jgi:hypothetical protein
VFGREFVVNVANKFANFLEGFVLLLEREFAELFNHLGRTHGANLLR